MADECMRISSICGRGEGGLKEKQGYGERQHSAHKSIKGQTPPKTHTVMVQYWKPDIYGFFTILINYFIVCL